MIEPLAGADHDHDDGAPDPRRPARSAPASAASPTTTSRPGGRAELNEAFEEHGLLIFEGVEPTPEDAGGDQHRLRAAQGPPEQGDAPGRRRPARRHRDAPRTERSAASSRSTVELLSQWLPWHFDHCYNDQLNRAGVLRAVEIPPDGGLTGFVDGIALYDAISPEVRDRIEGETVIYAMDVIIDNLRFGRPDGLRRGRGVTRRPST